MRSSSKRLSTAFVLSLLAVEAWGAQPVAVGDIALGQPVLKQVLKRQDIATGVSHYRVQRGAVDKQEKWQLMSGVALSEAEAADARACFAKLELAPSATRFAIPGAGAQPYQVLIGGKYGTRAEAQKASVKAQGLGCALYARHSSEEKSNASGPWVIDVVAIDPAVAKGQFLSRVGDSAKHLRTLTTQLAASAHAMLAINGGFFVERDVDGFPGQPAGISFIDGKLNSAPVYLRPTVFLTGDAAHPVSIVRQTDWKAYLQWSNGSTTIVDGVNRKPGLNRNCGRDAGEKPIHDYTCRYADDLVYYPPGSIFSDAVPAADRYSVSPAGAVRRVAAGDRTDPAAAYLVATPGSARIAQIDANLGQQATAQFHVDSKTMEAVGNKATAINGGPTLLAAGQYVREDTPEGWAIDAMPDDAAHKLLMHEWINRRNPRTAIGVRADGVVLLVAVDGHRHGESVGLTIEELRELMKSLGATEALNLDGGGSTALVIRDRLLNKPSDLTGERAVGDTVMFRAAQ